MLCPKILGLLLLTFALWSCAAALGVDEAPRSARLENSVLIECEGAYVHAATGVRFPKEESSFRRVALTQFDEDAYDVCARYLLQTQMAGMDVTIYVYPGPEHRYWTTDGVLEEARSVLLDREMNSVLASLENAYPEARLHERGASDLLQDVPGTCARYLYESDNSSNAFPIMTRADVFLVENKWLFKVRSTYSPAVKTWAEKRLANLVREIHATGFSPSGEQEAIAD